MSVSGKALGATMLLCWVLCLPAGAQTGALNSGKDQAWAQTPSVTVARPSRVRLGGFVLGAGFARYSGPYAFYPYSRSCFWPWYDAAFLPPYSGLYSPLWVHPGWFTGYAYGPGMGEVKLRSSLPDADVFLDDGFAGKAKDLKTMWLQPGAYNLKIEAGGREPFAVRIYVLSGKTLKIDTGFLPQREP